MTEKKTARWGKASLSPNSSLREALAKSRTAVDEIRKLAETLRKKAEELEGSENG